MWMKCLTWLLELPLVSDDAVTKISSSFLLDLSIFFFFPALHQLQKLQLWICDKETAPFILGNNSFKWSTVRGCHFAVSLLAPFIRHHQFPCILTPYRQDILQTHTCCHFSPALCELFRLSVLWADACHFLARCCCHSIRCCERIFWDAIHSWLRLFQMIAGKWLMTVWNIV